MGFDSNKCSVNRSCDCFSELADYYDEYHNYHNLFIRLLREEYDLDRNTNILDIGCGTGNETLNIFKNIGCNVYGIDHSENMLIKARQKTNEITWLNGIAESIPLKNNSVEIITSFFSTHHFTNKDKAFREFNRILKNNGMVFLITISHEQMVGSLEYTFFPELLEYDIKRVPPIGLLESVFAKNDFLVKTDTILYESRKIDADYIKMIENRYRTGLNFLSDPQIQEGIIRIKKAKLKNKSIVDSIMCTVLICKKSID